MALSLLSHIFSPRCWKCSITVNHIITGRRRRSRPLESLTLDVGGSQSIFFSTFDVEVVSVHIIHNDCREPFHF
jgi:hypothetical protein